MIKLIVVVAFAGLSALPAVAQSHDPSIGPGSPDGAVTRAPVGHRQPRAADVPANTTTDKYAREPNMDRVLKSICRGC
jgi:hypothetical protein